MALASTTPLGVYVHFPYCRARCPYCDFAIHVRRRLRHEELAAAIIAELGERAPSVAGRRLVSIYFGGGTPSLWEPGCVARVIGAVRAQLGAEDLAGGAIEVTLEANPDDLPAATLARLRSAGINRISLGAQSMDPARLVELGRLHGPEQTRRAVADARAAGFANLSLDLIHGLPGQEPAELERELSALVELAPEHLSAYQLTVEQRTPFGARARRGELAGPDPERQAELSSLLADRLGRAGYAHYEVSSFARRGCESVHNDLYWSGGEWLGLGPAAHSFRFVAGPGPGGDGAGERWANPRNVDRYIARWLDGPDPRPLALAGEDALREALTSEQLAREAMWLGLRRLQRGVERLAFAARFGDDPAVRFAAVLARLSGAGLLEIDDQRLRLTGRGALLADEVAVCFL